MNLTLLLPLSGILIAWLLVGSVQRHLSPRAATRVLSGIAVGSALAVTWALTLAVFGAAMSQPVVTRLAEWCRVSTPDHHPLPLWLGTLAAVLLICGVTRAVRALHFHARSDAAWRRACEVEIIDSLELIAFAVPGRPGTVVVSTAMLAALSQPERDAMLAHEHAHLRWNHHRYIRATEVAASFLPLLHPLVSRVRFGTERWADEEAVCATSDRTVVATAVAHAALASSAPVDLEMGGAGVPPRVEALLRPRPVATNLTHLALGLSSAAVMLGLISATLQLRQLVTFAGHVCTAH
jgi:Zn-dependent protease with chaperone function